MSGFILPSRLRRHSPAIRRRLVASIQIHYNQLKSNRPPDSDGGQRRRTGMEASTLWKDGLEDVIAGRSAICQVDGAAGRLYYRGYEIGELATAASFEEVVYLLWFGE